MPVTSSSMEHSDSATPDTSIDIDNAANRRKSGRARQKPVLLNKDPNIPQLNAGSAKRKRAEIRLEEAEDLSDDEDGSSQNESDPDEEELKERRRKAARSKKSTKKPATKKAKTGPGLMTNLAVRPAVNGAKRIAKPKQSRARPLKDVADLGTGLYAEIFSQTHTLDAVAADWIARWEQNNTEAMRELVNLVIRCTGCKIEVETHDIEDPDNVVSKLTEIQDEFQAQGITDYPLISKAKGNTSFRSTMAGFFETLINTCHASGLLYSDAALYENLDLWVSTMSSSGLRPFRHTATTISLTMGSALCRVANDLADTAAKTARQKEGEQKKKSVNKDRVRALEAKIVDEGKRRTSVIEMVQQLFDQVYIHRYRDVDPKIRVDCVSALGNWISALPDHFFEGMYLRYLGWVSTDSYPEQVLTSKTPAWLCSGNMSFRMVKKAVLTSDVSKVLCDTIATTRLEVTRQLSKLFKNKDNVARLRTFTERFRARLVEMSIQDTEISVRVATIELLDTIRKTGLLEPDDIDNVGRLVFDTEPRVRKAVAGFFAENINDLFETILEDLGGEESLAEALGDEADDEYDTPRMSWLKLKCVAEALESYDAEDEEGAAQPEKENGLIAAGGESRYAIAAQTIYEGILEAREWEVLTGYLLYDFSSSESVNEAADVALKERCKLNEKEELLLLEILNVSVKGRLSEPLDGEHEKKSKRTKAQREEAKGIQEAAALHLAQVIPRLLKKFGSNSSTATAVLRLEHVLNLEIFQELRQDSTAYASLLDDINKQFLTHADQTVLAEASTALLHARGFEDLDEVTGDKLGELWDETVNALRMLMTVEITENIADLCYTVRRIENLASISDCTDVFDHENRAPAKQKPKSATKASPRSFLMDLIRDPVLDSEAGEEADELLVSAARSLLFYFMWSARSLQSAISSKEAIETFPDYSSLSEALTSLISSRHKLSSVRIAATGNLLDLHTLFATFRHTSTQIPSADDISHLTQSIPINAQPLILLTYNALEKLHAKKGHKTIEAADLDEDLASNPEDSSDEEDDEDTPQARQEALNAEKQLCELTGKMVLAIVGRVLDHDGPKKGKLRERLQRNKTRLGPNFKEVVAYLDGPKTKAKKGRAAGAAKKGGKKAITSAEVVEESESEDEGVNEEGGELDLRERELVEDRIVDPDEEIEGEENARAGADEVEDGDDDIMGD